MTKKAKPRKEPTFIREYAPRPIRVRAVQYLAPVHIRGLKELIKFHHNLKTTPISVEKGRVPGCITLTAPFGSWHIAVGEYLVHDPRESWLRVHDAKYFRKHYRRQTKPSLVLITPWCNE